MAQVSDSIAATVTLKGDAAIRDLTTLSRKAKETDRAFNETAKSSKRTGSQLADGTSRAGSSATKAAGGFGNLQRNVSSASSKLAVFSVAAGAVGTATASMFSAANAASKLNEQVTSSAATFGSAAGVVRDWSRTTASSLGVSASAALKASTTFGAFFKQAGFGQGAAAKMSTTLVQLAGDLASFKDVDVDTALAAISSGLAGESEPLRRIGVDLRIAKVDAEALAQGFADTKDAITETDRVAARYVSLLRQTTDAQGDAARTANDYANSQRRFNAAFEDFKAAGGQAILPALTNITRGLESLLLASQGTSGLKRSGADIGDYLESIGKGAAAGLASGGLAAIPVFLHTLGEQSNDTASKVEAAGKVYNDAVTNFGEGSPQATAAQKDLRAAVDEAEASAIQSGQAFESTARAQARMAEETAAAVGTIRGFMDAIRGAEDAEDQLVSTHMALEDAEHQLAELRRKGKVDLERVVDAEQSLRDASQSTTDARLRVRDAEKQLSDLRRKGPVDLREVADAERSVAMAIRGVTSARRDLIDAEKEIARLRSGPTGDEATDAARDILRAQLDLERAQLRQVEAMQAVNDSRGSDTLGATYDLRDADLALAEATTTLAQAQQAQIDLNNRGLPGSEALREAEERAQEARVRLSDATYRQSEAEADARLARAGDPEYAEKIAALTRDVEVAHRGVESAIRSQDKAARDLREARAGDPEFERKMERAIWQEAQAFRTLERAEQDLPFATYEAQRAQASLNATLSANREEAYRLYQNLHLLTGQTYALATAAQRLYLFGGTTRNIAPAAGTPTVPLGSLPGRAAGGPVLANRSYVVGEKRPEVLTMGSQSGFIHPAVPSGSGSSASSQPIVVQVVLDGRVVAESVTNHQAGKFLRGGQRP